MQVNRKKLVLTVIIIIVIIAAILIGHAVYKAQDNGATGYYYEFEYDDNLITQSVRVYDGSGEIQSDYYLYYDGQIITTTKADKAVLTIVRVDLKDHQELEMAFRSDPDTKYKVVHKDER